MESNQDVFISHSSADSKLAFAMCDYLEEKGIRCWIAPRDIPVGVKYGKSIIMGVKTCKIMVVLFNRNSNASEAVETEVERAFNYKTILIPFKLDETIPSDSLEFSFGSFQWLNATKGKPEDHFDLLYHNCLRALGKKENSLKEKPILPETTEKKRSPANKKNESKKKKWVILIASLLAIALISIFFYMRKNLTDEEGEFTIGDQTWTTKNLDVIKYKNGDPIQQVQDSAAWANLTKGAWCYYENDSANGKKYGKLYNWYAVNDPRGLAPKGYHIPSDEEWTVLRDNLGDTSVAGTKMKSSSGWKKDRNGNNTIEFEGLPGGYRDYEGSFTVIGANGYWWSCSGTSDIAFYRQLSSPSDKLLRYNKNMKCGLSVRCLKDQSDINNKSHIGNENDQSNKSHKYNYNRGLPRENLDQTTYSNNPVAVVNQSNSIAEGTNASQKDQFNSAVELIQIGKQFWSAKCLDVSTYRNGDTIQKVEAPYQWGKLKEGAWCYYDNKTANGTKYGKLYNWYAVNDPRGLAPKGYHIPTRDDIIILNDFLGKSSEGSTKIKSASSIDELKGGYRNFEGTFTGIGEILKWWSSTEQNAEYAYCRELINIHGNLGKPIYDKHCGFPVRFLKD